MKALEESIKKWEGVLQGKEERGYLDCALCTEYIDLLCNGCPIREKTGMPGCEDTPYAEWLEHFEVEHPEEAQHKILCPTCRKIAERELAFLKSLREETPNDSP